MPGLWRRRDLGAMSPRRALVEVFGWTPAEADAVLEEGRVTGRNLHILAGRTGKSRRWWRKLQETADTEG